MNMIPLSAISLSIMPNSASTASPLAPPLAPIVIGVSGHRDLRDEDRPRLEQLVTEILEETLRRYPNTPLLILSPLAEGADQLVADVALRLKNVSLVATLPMPRPIYERDFADSPTALKEFRRLIDRAVNVIEIPILPGHSPESFIQNEDHRRLQYQLAGQFICLRCQILIALWDGVDKAKSGGTSYVVETALSGRLDMNDDLLSHESDGGSLQPWIPASNDLDPSEFSLIWHIRTPRKKCPDIPDPLTATMLIPREVKKRENFLKHFAEVLQRIDHYNFDIRKSWTIELSQAAGPINTAESLAEWPEAVAALSAHYRAANHVAIKFQSTTYQTLKAFMGVGIVAAISFGAYSHLSHEGNQGFWAALYLAIVSLSTLWFLYHRHGGFQSKFEDYRALAEALRVQIFWRAAALNRLVSDHYLRSQRSDLDWIRYAVQGMTLAQPFPAKSETPHYELLRSRWVADQYDYFIGRRNKAHAHRRSFIRWHAASVSLLAASLIHTAAHLGHHLSNHFDLFQAAIFALAIATGLIITVSQARHILAEWHHDRELVILELKTMALWGLVSAALSGLLLLMPFLLEEPNALHFHAGAEYLGHWWLTAIALNAVFAGLCHYYSNKRAFLEHARQFERAGIIFKNALENFDHLRRTDNRRLSSNDNTVLRDERLDRLIIALGCEALEENGTWLLLHRHRPIDVPHVH